MVKENQLRNYNLLFQKLLNLTQKVSAYTEGLLKYMRTMKLLFSIILYASMVLIQTDILLKWTIILPWVTTGITLKIQEFGGLSRKIML